MQKPAGNKIDSLLASIEGLHAQANYADGGHQPSVAPDTAKSDVVHLDTVLVRRTEESRQRPQASGQTTQKTSRIEEDDFPLTLEGILGDGLKRAFAVLLMLHEFRLHAGNGEIGKLFANAKHSESPG